MQTIPRPQKHPNLNHQPSGGSYEKEFPECANRGSGEILYLPEAFLFLLFLIQGAPEFDTETSS
jgi:hypothetical protein